MPETIVLDPAEVATSRTEINITPWVGEEGIDWGDAEIAAYMADQSRGATPVDFRVPNRTITIPLVLKTVGGTAFATARTNVQAKAALFQREGGWVKRLTSSGGTVFADVVNATLKLSGGWMQAHRNADIEASLVLEATPDFYGAEITQSDHVTTTASELVFTETGVQGNFPGRCRVVVDEDQGESQLGLLWAVRSRHYSAASTAATKYEAEALTPLDTAAVASLSGASGGTVVTHSALSTSWTPVVGTNIGGTAFLTHTGTNRLFVRYRSTSGTAVQMRAVYDVGDLALPTENVSYRAQAGTALFVADLGELRLDASPVGTHRWQGQIQAKGEVGGENVSIDEIWIPNVDEGFGKLTAPLTASTGLVTYSGRDEFNHTAGTLSTKTAPVGGGWVTAGAATDFTVNTTNHTVERSTVSEAGQGRIATLNTNIAASLVEVNLKAPNMPSGQRIEHGVVARYVDANNWLGASLGRTTLTSQLGVSLFVAGVSTELYFETVTLASSASYNDFYTVRLLVDVTGRWSVWVYPANSFPGLPKASGWSSVLSSSGSLASGDVGFRDHGTAAGAVTREYDSFLAFVPATDAVLFPSRTAQISTTGVRRLDSTGAAYGPVSTVVGDLPRLPPAGLEGRTTEVFVKASRGDFGQIPDIGIDDLSVRVYYRPCWLFVP